MLEKALHRKLKIEQHESRLNRGELGCTTSVSISSSTDDTCRVTNPHCIPGLANRKK